MQTLTRSVVPEWLHKSDLFISLANDDSVFNVPENCLQAGKEVNSANFQSFLDTTMYWGVNELPEIVISYYLQQEPTSGHYGSQYELAFPALFEVARWPDSHKLCVAVGFNAPEIIKYLLSSGFPARCTNKEEEVIEAVEVAAQCGWIQNIEALSSRGYALHSNLYTRAFCGAQRMVLEYLCENHSLAWPTGDFLRSLPRLPIQTSRTSNNGSHLDCLKYALAHGCPIPSSTTAFAIQYGYLEMLQYLNETLCLPWPFDLVQQLLKRSCTGDSVTPAVRACLDYAYEQGFVRPVEIMREAARNGDLTRLKDAHRLGAPLDQLCLTLSLQHGHLDCLSFTYEETVCFWPLDIVSYVLDGGAPITTAHQACVHYAHMHGCDRNSTATYAAAQDGNLVRLIDAHSLGATLDAACCTVAVLRCHLHCLKYLHEHGCPWNEDTGRAAASSGRLPLLQYVVEQGCPVTDEGFHLVEYYEALTDPEKDSLWSNCLMYAMHKKILRNPEVPASAVLLKVKYCTFTHNSVHAMLI